MKRRGWTACSRSLLGQGAVAAPVSAWTRQQQIVTGLSLAPL